MASKPVWRVLHVTCIGLTLLLGACWFLDRILPSPVPEEVAWSTRVVDRQGEILRLFTTDDGFWRLPARLQKTDPEFIDQLLAYEDKRFWTHPGVDLLAVARATLQTLASGRVVSGASTLTMQTVRLLEPRPRTIAGKLVEMVQALRLERSLSKQAILELYLSLAPYGGNIQGIEAASHFYFHAAATHFTPSQAALLISLPQSPESRRPDLHPLRAKRARQGVLHRLRDSGLLSKEDAQLAALQPIPAKRYPAPFSAPQLSQSLLREYAGNHRITTTLNYKLQKKAEAIAAQVQQELPSGKTLALLVVDNQTRQILVHVGSGDFQTSQLDLTRAIRSPGSTLKPFIYGLAFEQGRLHPETRILDRPRRFDAYGPANFDGNYHGWISARQALQQSLNIPAVQVLEHVGPQRLLSRFSQLGVALHYQKDPGLSLALGGVGCSLQDLVALYSGLANNGYYQALQTILKREPTKNEKLLSPLAAWYVDASLPTLPASANQPGIGGRSNTVRFKTGTSYGFRDAWAVGYNQNYTVGIWVGRPDGGYGKETTGANTAVPVLRRVFASLPQTSSLDGDAAPPPGTLLVNYDQLPPDLQWFAGEQPDTFAARKPKIYFPVDGSTLDLTETAKNPADLALKSYGGTPPFYWLINGRPLGPATSDSVAAYTPQGPGKTQITLIDSKGKRDSVAVWLETRPVDN